MIEANKTPTRTTLHATPERALRFLWASTRNDRIKRALATVGFGAAAHAEGWRLLKLATGFDALAEGPALDSEAIEALAALDAWDEPFFTRADAALTFDFPEQHAFLFAGGLGPATGPATVLGVTTFLDRLDALERGEGRDATRAEDQAALAALATVGLHPGERDRARTLVAKAQRFVPAAEAAPAVDADARLVDLWRWHRKWSALAHTAIKRRDHLIQLGLATPRASSEAEEPVEEPGTPIPTPA